MAEIDSGREDWTEGQIDQIVSDYFAMLAMDLRNEAFLKAERNRALQERIGRNRSAIEFKHQNISAVMVKLGLPWLTGYRPLAHFQKALVEGVERHLLRHPEPVIVPNTTGGHTFAEASTLIMEAPPEPTSEDQVPVYVERLVQKFDPAARDARNRELGKRGENVVYLSEIARLRAENREDLSRKVRWVAQEDGDGAGYDILSFERDGSERLLEVKTTVGGNKTPFYISENERQLSDERPEAFRLVRLYDFARNVRGFEIEPPLADHLRLTASVWKASIA